MEPKSCLTNEKGDKTMTLIRFKPAPRNYPAFPNLLENFFNSEFPSMFESNRNTLPAVNIFEDKDSFRIELAAPGMEKTDFRIEVDQKALRISASREGQSEEKESTYTRREFSYESFHRSFTLPETADGDNISASYDKGILYVSIPKRDEAKQKPSREIMIA
jgi:HSP20 family protein